MINRQPRNEFSGRWYSGEERGQKVVGLRELTLIAWGHSRSTCTLAVMKSIAKDSWFRQKNGDDLFSIFRVAFPNSAIEVDHNPTKGLLT
jgi:hypothetical protein